MGRISLPNNTVVFFDGDAGEVRDDAASMTELRGAYISMFVLLMCLHKDISHVYTLRGCSGKKLQTGWVEGHIVLPTGRIVALIPETLLPIVGAIHTGDESPYFDQPDNDESSSRILAWARLIGEADARQTRTGQDVRESGDGSVQAEVCEDSQALPESLQGASEAGTGPGA